MQTDEGGAASRIAVIGMAGRFPGARSIEEFWRNLVGGVETIRFFTDEEWRATSALRSGPEAEANHATSGGDYVRARGVLDDIELFDAEFFGYRPRDVEVMDPQQRLFLEQAWVALEHAGYDSAGYDGAIGVYGGVSRNTYLLNNLRHALDRLDGIEDRQTETGNERDYVASRVAYKMDLRGPAVAVHSACSTSLLAIHYACQDLLSHQCDMALAGGASVRVPQVDGYVYSETGILSRDGRCRPFAHDASGTNIGNGVGVVVLKRLEDALRDGDMIWAVVLGSATNNDGASKLSYMAPSVEGQAEVIACAMGAAGVDPDTISYLECHGTGTRLGDPIEIEGLRQSFGDGTGSQCWIGSVKGNIGHLDAAAGVAGFIKLVLALHHRKIPASLHFHRANPECQLEDGRFQVVSQTMNWESGHSIRRGGVSAFGVGGTNVHAILEEFSNPPQDSSGSEGPVVLAVSARSSAALKRRWADLADHLASGESGARLSDVGYTLALGRRPFDYRSVLVGETTDQAVELARKQAARQVVRKSRSRPSITFMFPGQGSQCEGMGKELYATHKVFRDAIDCCHEVASSILGFDFRSHLFGQTAPGSGLPSMDETSVAQPALFAIEYALAQVWRSYGVEPKAMIGHSVGEYVAACVAKVFDLEQAVALVCARARLMQSAERGSMLAVLLPESELKRFSNNELSLAAVNAPDSCVISGSTLSIDALAAELGAAGVACRRLRTSHAFHSSSMEPILDEFRAIVQGISLNVPERPFISNLSGEWITREQATDPDYWAQHLRRTVRFHQGIEVLLREGTNAFVEVGPGRVLSGTVRRIAGAARGDAEILTTLGEPATSESAQLLEGIGRAWALGAEVRWNCVWNGSGRRVPLPTYPFEKSRYWIDPVHPQMSDMHDKNDLTQISCCDSPLLTPPPPESTEGVGRGHDGSRYTRVLGTLVGILNRMSGLEITEADYDTRFQDLGFDSLFLAQANGELKKQFKVRIGFRQLLEEAPTPAALARFIDAASPPEPPRSVNTMVLPTPLAEDKPSIAATNAVLTQALPLGQGAADVNGLAGVLQRQLEIMADQLRILAGSGLPSEAGGRGGEVTQGKGTPSKVAAIAVALPPKVPAPKTISKKSSAELTARQKEGIAALTARYCARTRGSKDFMQSVRPRLADNRAIVGFRAAWKEMVYQIVTVRSEGSKLWDVDGNEYVDLKNCFGANLLGHSHPEVVHAIQEQLRRGYEVGPQNRMAGEVAERVCAMTGVQRLTFAHSGCEAVQYAVRIARAASGRQKFMMFEGDVHGRGDLILARSVDQGEGLRTVPAAAGVPYGTVADTFVMQYGTERALEVLRDHAEDMAAVLIEPVRTRNPDLQPIEFLKEIRRITHEHGICMISDEVVMGFRVHPGGAQAFFDYEADMVTYGKVLGGGLPIGVVAGRHEYLDFIDGGMWSFGDISVPESGVTRSGGTMIKHPLSMAASLAVLGHLQKEGPALQAELNRRTTLFAEDVNRTLRAEGIPLHIEQFASYFKPIFLNGVEFENLLYCHLRDRGVHCYVDFPLFFSTAHSEADIRKVAEAFKDSAREMMQYGFFERDTSGVWPAAICIGGNDEGIVTGSMPLMSNQFRFLVERQCPQPHGWGIFGVRECLVRLDADLLRRAFNRVTRHHDALRMQVKETSDGAELYINEPQADVPFAVYQIEERDPASRERTTEELICELRKQIVLMGGPLVRMALFDFVDGTPQRLFLMVHHLASDGYSWSILWEDLEAAYEYELRGERWQPSKSTSLRSWAMRMEQLAQTPAMIEKTEDWLALPWDSVVALPRDLAGTPRDNTNETVEVLQIEFDPKSSHALSHFRRVYKSDLLVAAVAQAVSEWSGAGTVLMDLLGHGREDLFEDLDVSRTVGFFAWYTPVVLKVEPSRSGEEWASNLFRQIDSIRDLGPMSHDVLRFMCKDKSVKRHMSKLPRAEILINFQGRFDDTFPASRLFTAGDPGKPSDLPDGRRYYPLTIRGDIVKQQWVVTFVYSNKLHQMDSIRRTAERVKQLLHELVVSTG
jgi:acyl transferase domain-containing protein/glutamate-1-semialdehyde aminotransferase/acyl carrier protein